MASKSKARVAQPLTPFELGVEHHRAGRAVQAEAAYRRALEQQHNQPQAHFLLGALLLETGRTEQATTVFEQGVQLNPNDPVLHTNLGEAYRRLGRQQDAANALVRAVSLKPDLAEASFNLGITLRDLGEQEASLMCLVRAVDVAPEKLKFQLQLADSLVAAGELDRAVGHYQCALALSPSSPEVLLALASALRTLKRHEGALAMSRRAVSLQPALPLAHWENGKSLTEQGHYDAAIAAFHQALQLSPNYEDAHFGMGCAMVETGQLSEALAHFRRVLKLSPDHHIAHSNLIFMLAFHPACTAEELLREAQSWSKRFAEPLSAQGRPHGNTPDAERRLRIGYVASTFHNHCQAFFLLPLLGRHNHSDFEIFCYASVQTPDEVTERMQSCADAWRDIYRMPDSEVADLIRRDEIDILVDLTMHMSNTRLPVFGYKPAPVQVTWLAYPGTTGLSCMDYRVTDALLDPPGASLEVYSEKPLSLPDAFWCYHPLRSDPSVSPLPAASAPYVTFGCLNAFWKLHPAVFALWARVLLALPSSRLLVLAPEGSATERVLSTFEEQGVARARIECVPRRTRLDYLTTYQCIDICLDSFPYNGHTTSLDAFWMGVPVVTLVADRVVGRAGLCQATLLKLPELIAHTEEEFVQRAVALASDLPTLAELRAGLRERIEKSPLMDSALFTKNLEGAYRKAWRTWCLEQASS